MTKAKGKKKITDSKQFKSALFFIAVVALSVAYYFLSPYFLSEKPCYDGDFPIINQSKIVSDLEVVFIDVGQGDSILIKTPSEQTILIDAGAEEDYSGVNLVKYLKSCGVKTIDYAIITHPDADHTGGFISVFDKFKVKFVFRPYVRSDNKLTDRLKSRFNPQTITYCDTDTYANLLLSINSERSNWVYIDKDTDLIFDYADGKTLKLDFLTPTAELSELSYTDLNNYSPLIKITYAGKSFMLTGDASKTVEEEALSFYPSYVLACDVLKVAHHGSDTSTSYSFVKAVSPSYAVISCGEGNIYKHPKSSVLTTLLASNAKLFRTDLQGSITFTVNSSGDLSMSTEKIYNGSLGAGY